MESHVSRLSSHIGVLYKTIKHCLKFTNIKRQLILNAKLSSIVMYSMQLFFGESHAIRRRLEQIMLKIYKVIYESKTYMMKTTEIRR